MGSVDFSGLKLKLIGSLVAISVIELLKDFIELAGQDHVGGGTKWRIVIHLTFVASGVLFALMDWIADKREGSFTMTQKNGDSTEVQFIKDRLDE